MTKLILISLSFIFASTIANANRTLTCKTESYSENEAADRQDQFGVTLQIDSAGNLLNLVILKGSFPSAGEDSAVNSPSVVFSNDKVTVYNIKNDELGDQTYYNPRLFLFKNNFKSVKITHGYSTDDGASSPSSYDLKCK